MHVATWFLPGSDFAPQGDAQDTFAFLGWDVDEGKRGPKIKGCSERFVPALWVN